MFKSRLIRELPTLAPWAMVVAMGVAAILSLPHQVGTHASYDAYRYLAGAESILSKGQYRSPTGAVSLHYPPGTSLIYAGLARLKSTSPEAVEVDVNVGAYVLMALAVYCLLRMLQVHPVALVLALPCILLNGFILSLHNKVWSEPLFLPVHCTFLAVLSAVFAAPAKRQSVLLVLAAFLLGVGYVLRYAVVGAVPILAGVALVALWRSQRAWLTVVFMLVAAFVPVGTGWFLAGIKNVAKSPRTMGLFTPVDRVVSNLWSGCAEFVEQLLPEKYLGRVGFVCVGIVLFAMPLLVTGLSARPWRKKDAEQSEPNAPPATCGLPVRMNTMLIATYVLYFAFIACVELFVDPTTRFNLRILCPAYIVLISSLALTATLLISRNGWPTKRQQVCSAVAGCLLLCVLAVAGGRAVKFSLARIKEPVSMELAGREELLREVQEVVRQHGADKRLVSNAQGLAWYALRSDVAELDHPLLKLLATRRDPHEALLLFRSPDIMEGGLPGISEVLKSTGAVTVYSSSAVVFARFDVAPETLVGSRAASP